MKIWMTRNKSINYDNNEVYFHIKKPRLIRTDENIVFPRDGFLPSVDIYHVGEVLDFIPERGTCYSIEVERIY